MTRRSKSHRHGLHAAPATRWTQEQHAALEALYARIPAIECKGYCQHSCGIHAAPALERERVEEASGIAWGAKPMSATCAQLGDDGRCRAYAVRPLACRLWGVARGTLCSWGCRPERILSAAETRALIRVAIRISGDDPEEIRREALRYFELHRVEGRGVIGA